MRKFFWPFLCFLSGAIIIADEVLKKIALVYFLDESALSDKKIVALAIHKNFGLAFDLPVWLPIILALSSVILIGLVVFAVKNWSKEKILAAAALIIAFGATGNLFDRLIYGFTVDYLIFPATGSAFNLSDVVILLGLSLLIWQRKTKNKKA